ncbi:MAG: M48 family metallopeptidase [Candidatus Marinimicrobia bacterium]|nr:M48 family metallopeptidase [Candidatus Neomarinimicrobiota bacterium]
MTAEVHVVEYGSQSIEYSLIRSKRRTLGIHVYPDLSVTVRAPLKAALGEITKLVRRRGAWIIKKQHYFATFLPPVPPSKYESGETHRYLGRQYRLKVMSGDKPATKLKAGHLEVIVTGNTNNGQVQKQLQLWYLERANQVFAKRLEVCLEPFQKTKIASLELTLRTMKTRWGSCSPRGRITLNTHLIRLPKRCIDYVITHELCHLKQPNHGEGFYRLLNSVMPDWRDRREKLNWYGSR